MRLVIQRVSKAAFISAVFVRGRGAGLLILAGIEEEDTEEDVRWLANKAAAMRIFSDADGKMNLSVREVGGSALVVSSLRCMPHPEREQASFIRAASLSGPFPV